MLYQLFFKVIEPAIVEGNKRKHFIAYKNSYNLWLNFLYKSLQIA